MDPLSIGIASGIILGTLALLGKWRSDRSPKGRIREHGKRARRDAGKASKEYKNKVKNIAKHY